MFEPVYKYILETYTSNNTNLLQFIRTVIFVICGDIFRSCTFYRLNNTKEYFNMIAFLLIVTIMQCFV